MVLVGWLVSQAIETAEPKLKGAVWVLMAITVGGCIIAPLGIPVAGFHYHGKATPLDLILAGGSIALALPALMLLKKRHLAAATIALAGAWSLIVVVVRRRPIRLLWRRHQPAALLCLAGGDSAH
jgi:hypothetical protein